MKRFLFLMVLSMACKEVVGSIRLPHIWRCENEEVVCYTRRLEQSGIYCKFKGVK